MTEAEWDICADGSAMLAFLCGRSSERKLRLFACACCWKIADCLTEETRALVTVAEKLAEGQISANERKIARAKSFDASWNLDPQFAHRRGPAKSAVAWALARGAFKAATLSALYSTNVITLEYVGRVISERKKRNPSDGNTQISAAAWDTARKQAGMTHSALLRCLIGNPFRLVAIDPAWLAWNDAIVVRLAQAAYDNRILPAGALDNTDLAILADALEEAGCADESILGHLRSNGEHYRGCFVIDALLGKS